MAARLTRLFLDSTTKNVSGLWKLYFALVARALFNHEVEGEAMNIDKSVVEIIVEAALAYSPETSLLAAIYIDDAVDTAIERLKAAGVEVINDENNILD